MPREVAALIPRWEHLGEIGIGSPSIIEAMSVFAVTRTHRARSPTRVMRLHTPYVAARFHQHVIAALLLDITLCLHPL